MAPVAEDDGLCWWCCDCEGDGETCPHPVARCGECLLEDDAGTGTTYFDFDEDE